MWQGYIADRMVAGEASQWLVRDSQKLDKPLAAGGELREPPRHHVLLLRREAGTVAGQPAFHAAPLAPAAERSDLQERLVAPAAARLLFAKETLR